MGCAHICPHVRCLRAPKSGDGSNAHWPGLCQLLSTAGHGCDMHGYNIYYQQSARIAACAHRPLPIGWSGSPAWVSNIYTFSALQQRCTAGTLIGQMSGAAAEQAAAPLVAACVPNTAATGPPWRPPSHTAWGRIIHHDGCLLQACVTASRTVCWDSQLPNPAPHHSTRRGGSLLPPRAAGATS